MAGPSVDWKIRWLKPLLAEAVVASAGAGEGVEGEYGAEIA